MHEYEDLRKLERKFIYHDSVIKNWCRLWKIKEKQIKELEEKHQNLVDAKQEWTVAMEQKIEDIKKNYVDFKIYALDNNSDLKRFEKIEAVLKDSLKDIKYKLDELRCAKIDVDPLWYEDDTLENSIKKLEGEPQYIDALNEKNAFEAVNLGNLGRRKEEQGEADPLEQFHSLHKGVEPMMTPLFYKHEYLTLKEVEIPKLIAEFQAEWDVTYRFILDECHSDRDATGCLIRITEFVLSIKKKWEAREGSR